MGHSNQEGALCPRCLSGSGAGTWVTSLTVMAVLMIWAGCFSSGSGLFHGWYKGLLSVRWPSSPTDVGRELVLSKELRLANFELLLQTRCNCLLKCLLLRGCDSLGAGGPQDRAVFGGSENCPCTNALVEYSSSGSLPWLLPWSREAENESWGPWKGRNCLSWAPFEGALVNI